MGFVSAIAVALSLSCVLGAQTWRGLTIAEENRCSDYSADDYSYSSTVEGQIVTQQAGRIYSPYDGRYFASTTETDIEHVVARSEAHDSGLCTADAETRSAFANDLLNLTLADPDLNRNVKRDHDAGEWLPESNRCWYAATIVAVKVKYGLTVDIVEAAALERILRACPVTDMQFPDQAE